MKRVPASAICHCCLNLAVGLLLVVAACGTDQTAGPSHTPDHVIRAYPNSCVPSVISTVTDSTETDLVTFDSILTSVCYPNLISWGIDMADPAGVDTPQGSANWEMRNDNVANLPSGSFYAWPDNGSIAQTVIEFDPPVSSVSFYYSRLQNQGARWGGQAVRADSMMVYARSRIPGTTFYNEWDSRKLYSNVPSTTAPWTVWTQVTLSTSGDKIQWLWFDGNLVLDNLAITRKPLSCTSVQRGQQATCRVTPSGATVTSWDFAPDTAYPGVDTVHWSSSDTVWSGVAAASGKVTVHLTDGVSPRSFSAQLNVANRPSNWQATWRYRQGPEQTATDAEPGSGVTIGRNCPDSNPSPASPTKCLIATLWIQPDPIQHVGAGIIAKRISGGPNDGYWYVDSATYNMKRVGNVIPSILSTSPRNHPLFSISNQCRHALGFGKNDSAFANFYQYNDNCQNVAMATFVNGAYGHEGRGFNGGTGHQSLAEGAAALSQNDPYAAIEQVVYTDSASVVSSANSLVIPAAVNITTTAADGQNGPQGNYAGGSIWFWDTSSASFVMMNMTGF